MKCNQAWKEGYGWEDSVCEGSEVGKMGHVWKAGAVFQSCTPASEDSGEKALSRNSSIPVSNSTTPSGMMIDILPIFKSLPPSLSQNTAPGWESWLHTKCDIALSCDVCKKAATTELHALVPRRLQDDRCDNTSSFLFASRSSMEDWPRCVGATRHSPPKRYTAHNPREAR